MIYYHLIPKICLFQDKNGNGLRNSWLPLSSSMPYPLTIFPLAYDATVPRTPSTVNTPNIIVLILSSSPYTAGVIWVVPISRENTIIAIARLTSWTDRSHRRYHPGCHPKVAWSDRTHDCIGVRRWEKPVSKTQNAKTPDGKEYRKIRQRHQKHENSDGSTLHADTCNDPWVQ